MRAHILIDTIRRTVARFANGPARLRYRLAKIHLHGEGIEIGALHNPLPVGKGAKVRYVDRLSASDLRKQYPELATRSLVVPDIVDDGERLTRIADESLDFIIANHFIEHCEDPIGTLITFFGKLKPEGVVYLAVPDKRYSFDSLRASTGIPHLEHDHLEGAVGSRSEHFRDFARHSLLKGIGSDHEVNKLAAEMQENGYSIHFHVWAHEEFATFLRWLQSRYLPRLEILEDRMNRHEGIFVLRKRASPAPTSVSV